MEKATTPQVLHVRISRATEIIWEGDARTLTARNAEGPFDILPLHAHFISILDNTPIVVIEKNGERREFVFDTAVMHVKDDQVRVYTNIV
jgi:F0F1-type ATP synthase epsilon subunit